MTDPNTGPPCAAHATRGTPSHYALKEDSKRSFQLGLILIGGGHMDEGIKIMNAALAHFPSATPARTVPMPPNPRHSFSHVNRLYDLILLSRIQDCTRHRHQGIVLSCRRARPRFQRYVALQRAGREQRPPFPVYPHEKIPCYSPQFRLVATVFAISARMLALVFAALFAGSVCAAPAAGPGLRAGAATSNISAHSD